MSQIKIVRYLISGSTAAAVNLGILFLLTHYLNIWYISSSLIAFSAAFGVSFFLQKLWTFKSHSFEGVKRQVGMYLIAFVLGNALNVFLLFIFVEHFSVHYLLAQILSNGLIAIGNFFVYKHFVFLEVVESPQTTI